MLTVLKVLFSTCTSFRTCSLNFWYFSEELHRIHSLTYKIWKKERIPKDNFPESTWLIKKWRSFRTESEKGREFKSSHLKSVVGSADPPPPSCFLLHLFHLHGFPTERCHFFLRTCPSVQSGLKGVIWTNPKKSRFSPVFLAFFPPAGRGSTYSHTLHILWLGFLFFFFFFK